MKVLHCPRCRMEMVVAGLTSNDLEPRWRAEGEATSSLVCHACGLHFQPREARPAGDDGDQGGGDSLDLPHLAELRG